MYSRSTLSLWGPSLIISGGRNSIFSIETTYGEGEFFAAAAEYRSRERLIFPVSLFLLRRFRLFISISCKNISPLPYFHAHGCLTSRKKRKMSMLCNQNWEGFFLPSAMNRSRMYWGNPLRKSLWYSLSLFLDLAFRYFTSGGLFFALSARVSLPSLFEETETANDLLFWAEMWEVIERRSWRSVVARRLSENETRWEKCKTSISHCYALEHDVGSIFCRCWATEYHINMESGNGRFIYR